MQRKDAERTLLRSALRGRGDLRTVTARRQRRPKTAENFRHAICISRPIRPGAACVPSPSPAGAPAPVFRIRGRSP